MEFEFLTWTVFFNQNIISDNGHGTAVASIIIGKNVGVVSRIGFVASIFNTKVLKGDMKGEMISIASGLEDIIKHRQKDIDSKQYYYINFSILVPYESMVTIHSIFNKAYRNQILVIVGAGNDIKCLYI